MTTTEFRRHAHEMVDWMADYMDQVERYPVKSQVAPRQIYNQLPKSIPIEGESIETIFKDFENIIMPGVTHWQNPNFYAYFQANTSPPSILAEMLTATLGVQGMKWETSPASTELEEKVMDWLLAAMNFPTDWSGVIQDSASSATLTALLTAREQSSNYDTNKYGLHGDKRYRVYCSDQTHSSIEKGAKIAGIGQSNVVKIPTHEDLSMDSEALRQQVEKDIDDGYIPLCIVAALGTTGTMAMDPLSDIGVIANKHQIWLHVDAAYAGSAFILEEYQHLLGGIELADSFVFNPHKWLFTNFDCSAYFVKDKNALINTFAILPEYLKTQADGVVDNHCDWGVPLGRRFRSLKLWFVLRNYGLTGLQDITREHIKIAEWLEIQIKEHEDFELVSPRSMNLLCFRYRPNDLSEVTAINNINEKLLHKVNATGKIYITHTKVSEKYTLRMSIGQTNVTQRHVAKAWDLIQNMANNLSLSTL